MLFLLTSKVTQVVHSARGQEIKPTQDRGVVASVAEAFRAHADCPGTAPQRTIVQCKRWKGKPVPVQTVRELYGVLHDRRVSAAKLVATTNFTPDAIAFVENKPIELVDGDSLLRLIQGVQTSGKIALPIATERDHLTPDCPQCDSVMVLREAKRGARAGEKFWGCPDYPKCRGTRLL